MITYRKISLKNPKFLSHLLTQSETGQQMLIEAYWNIKKNKMYLY